MHKRKAFATGLIMAAGLFVFDGSAVGQSATRPNIVVIMVDDMDVDSLTTALAKGLMPNLERYFIDRGYNFAESFAIGAFGSASRATFLTGQYPHNHKEFGQNPGVGDAPRLNEASTVATWLKAAGYRTGIIGRYLTGYGLFTSPTYIPPGWDDWQVLIDPSTWSVDQYQMNLNGTTVDFGALSAAYGVELYQTDMLAVLARSFIQRAPAYLRPFFLYVSPVVFNREMFPGPSRYNVCPDPNDLIFGGNYWGVAQRPASRHLNSVFGDKINFPLPQGPNFNEADVQDKPDWLRGNAPLSPVDVDCLEKRYWRRLEGMRSVDDLVGYVMATLESTGLLNNTVVFFTADHGLMDGQHRFGDKSPAYEESVRVPLLVRTPWNTTPRQVSRMVLNTDLAPTIARLAQAAPTHAPDGRSILPLFQNPEHTPWRTIALIEHETGENISGFGVTFPPDYVAARTTSPSPRLFVKYPTVTSGVNGELYDLSTDPYRLENRYLDPARAAEVGRLEQWLNALKTCSGLTCYILETYFTLN